jgi:hypothetical protein
VLGDLVDRKQSQADHAAKEEKECMDKYLSKWETLDPGADREKERAGESQRVKEAALSEAQHYVRVRLKDSEKCARGRRQFLSSLPMHAKPCSRRMYYRPAVGVYAPESGVYHQAHLKCTQMQHDSKCCFFQVSLLS